MDEITYKYTKDGKKVVVLGKLNNTQWIVKEIFVSGNEEIPSGESFVETTLLDEPMETYKSKEIKRQEEALEKIKQDIDKYNEQRKIIAREAQASNLINKIIAKYENIDINELETFVDFVSGNITHLVTERYGIRMEIITITEALQSVDKWNCGTRFEGLKLLSLFGCKPEGDRYDDKKISLEWRINQYRDGSGHIWDTVYPCRSFKEAVSLMDELVGNMEKATSKTIALKEKYNLKNPSDEKIKAYNQTIIDNKIKQIEKAKEELKKKEEELKDLEIIRQIDDDYDRTK